MLIRLLSSCTNRIVSRWWRRLLEISSSFPYPHNLDLVAVQLPRDRRHRHRHYIGKSCFSSICVNFSFARFFCLSVMDRSSIIIFGNVAWRHIQSDIPKKPRPELNQSKLISLKLPTSTWFLPHFFFPWRVVSGQFLIFNWKRLMSGQFASDLFSGSGLSFFVSSRGLLDLRERRKYGQQRNSRHFQFHSISFWFHMRVLDFVDDPLKKNLRENLIYKVKSTKYEVSTTKNYF